MARSVGTRAPEDARTATNPGVMHADPVGGVLYCGT